MMASESENHKKIISGKRNYKSPQDFIWQEYTLENIFRSIWNNEAQTNGAAVMLIKVGIL